MDTLPDHPAAVLVAGIDEAGRGPLMGDVVAACVILDPARPIAGLNDSKKLSEKRREALAPVIRAQALGFGIGRCTPEEIDRLNILQATMEAMRRAFFAMNLPCAQILIDGNRVPAGLPVPATAVVRGDATVEAIMAASILAKTTRDAQMRELDAQYPEYGFARHKGYPTAAHLKLLEQLPVLPCYRRSYAPVRAVLARRAAVAGAH